ncbi:cilia- and flagella-associated protein 418 [Anabrus simplex]|uniref:cilia- and flagella-associated protein 418 n=1 Tax=Anabrus simplex TaxID=316456 RepID=UPI0035A28084
MDEDLDDLLEEVENKFIKHNNGENVKKLEVKITSPNSSFSDDTLPLDDIIPDVKNEDSNTVNNVNNIPGTKSPTRCFPVFLGGADIMSGLSTIGNQRSCSNLHCTTCDFTITTFNNFRWLEETDYLFLRTNMPDFERVKCCLRRAPGWRAYACQCRHFSTKLLQTLNSLPSFTWICKSH